MGPPEAALTVAFTDRQLVTIATNISFLGHKRKHLGIIPSSETAIAAVICLGVRAFSSNHRPVGSA
jgi:hypothetical protein